MTITSYKLNKDNEMVPEPKFLPDLDDMSMNSIIEYMEYCEQDMAFSILSNAMFLSGGISYVVLSLWQSERYYGLDLLAPSVYLMNSVVDVLWARHVAERAKMKRSMVIGWDDWRMAAVNNGDSVPPLSRNHTPKLMWYQKLYKHAAHRRSHLAAISFGLAALFAVLQVLVDWYHPNAEKWSGTMDSLSIYMYLLSSIVSISGKRTRPWFHGVSRLCSSSSALEDCGDLFFLLGSLLDVILCDNKSDSSDADYWFVLSSILWLADACFYLRADLVNLGHRRSVPDQDLPLV